MPADRPAEAPAATQPASGVAAVSTAPHTGYTIAQTALGLVGFPYRSGGSDPAHGFDCSGLVWYAFAQHGLTVPRNVDEQYRSGHPVGAVPLEPGDLVFFSTVAPGPSHVGIAIGGDEFVHAPSSNGQVRVEHLSAPYWSSRYVGAKRIPESLK